MKELTIEEKAKAYDEAIKRAKSLYDNNQPISGSNVIINNIFPEFKESGNDDERMWKLIKKYAHSNISDVVLNADHITREQLESWLEKICEQKSINDALNLSLDIEKQNPFDYENTQDFAPKSATEAPEEIYITYEGYGVFGDAVTMRTSDSQIEYVRKDAFINKKDLVTKIEGLKKQYTEFAPTYFFNIILDLLNTTEVKEKNNPYKE